MLVLFLVSGLAMGNDPATSSVGAAKAVVIDETDTYKRLRIGMTQDEVDRVLFYPGNPDDIIIGIFTSTFFYQRAKVSVTYHRNNDRVAWFHRLDPNP